MLTIEYGTNNKEEKGKIIYSTEVVDMELIKTEITKIKELYSFMVHEQRVNRIREVLDKRP